MIVLIGGCAAVLFVSWVRKNFHRNRYDRAFSKAVTNGMKGSHLVGRAGAARAASVAFWKLASLCLVVVVIRIYAEVHGR
jgi:hypothetical protein